MERVVRVLDHDVRLVGQDGDSFIEDLPGIVREPALDYAELALPADAVVIDAGASLGILSLGFSFIAPRGRVIAIEASPGTYACLVENLATAHASNVETLHVAVGESAGTLEFFSSPWFSAGSFVKKETFSASLHQGSTKVQAERIDDIVERLGLDRLDLIKIDIEGHELPALHGARETIRRFTPAIVVEMNFFTITSLANTMPAEFLSEICALFPYVYDYAPGEGVFLIAEDLDIYTSVRRQFRTGRPSDLICRFEAMPAEIEAELARRAVNAVDDAANRRIAELEAEATELRAQVQAASEALDTAATEMQALQGSKSWRVTAPMRDLGDRLRSRRRPN
jgi:FkbM family methyltransferase